MSTASCKKVGQQKFPLYIPVIGSLSVYESLIPPPFSLIYVGGKYFTDGSFVTLGGIPCKTFFNGAAKLGFYVPTGIKDIGIYGVVVNNPNWQPNPGVLNNSYLTSNTAYLTFF
jgi:hypothetical protein